MVNIGPLDPGELDAALRLHQQSFGPAATGSPQRWLESMTEACAAGRAYAVRRRAGELVGIARVIELRQWWNGRLMPVAGIADVAVAAHERGARIGRLMMAEVLAAIRAEFAAAILYPFATTLYGRLGWRAAGVQRLGTVSLAELRQHPDLAARADSDLRTATSADAREIADLVADVHRTARASGPLEWSGSALDRWLTEDGLHIYLGADALVGFRWTGDALVVEAAIGRTREATATVWRLIGANASTTTEAEVFLAPRDPVDLLAHVRTTRERVWWLRLLDIGQALAARGYPTAREATVELAVDDPMLPANSGVWRLHVADGTAIAERVPEERTGRVIRLKASGAAALFAGTPTFTLRRAGEADGGDRRTDELLDGLFAAQPYMLDFI